MLVLSRKLQQEILVGDNVKITVLKVKGNTVRLGIEAPPNVRVVRGELTPLEEPTRAEVTVVFDDNSVSSESRNVVPFPNTTEPMPHDRARIQSGQRTDHESISFKQRLPKSLQHNRLKTIVNELTVKKS